jgi:hypothetical protein
MPYAERLHYWAIARLLPNHQWVIVARFHRRSDADGHLRFLHRVMPDIPMRVVFDLLAC